jgi:hypothetical protein
VRPESSSLERGKRDRVGPERGHHVGVELESEDLAEVAERGLAEAVDEGGVDVVLLQPHPGLVEGPGGVHLDVALRPGWPDAHRVEGGHEAERAADEVVGRARANEADVVLRDADVGEDLADHRQEHLDLVARTLAAEVVSLGEGDDRHRPVPLAGGWGAHRYSL